MPIGILGSLNGSARSLRAGSAVIVGLVPYTSLGVAAPMAVAIDAAKASAAGTAWAGLFGVRGLPVKPATIGLV